METFIFALKLFGLLTGGLIWLGIMSLFVHVLWYGHDLRSGRGKGWTSFLVTLVVMVGIPFGLKTLHATGFLQGVFDTIVSAVMLLAAVIGIIAGIKTILSD